MAVGFDLGSCLPTGANHPQNLRVLACQIFGGNARKSSNARFLEETVMDHGQQFAG